MLVYVYVCVFQSLGTALMVRPCVHRALAEKHLMYSVSQGLNSGCPGSVLFLSGSTDFALRLSTLWVWSRRSTSRLVLARSADAWI